MRDRERDPAWQTEVRALTGWKGRRRRWCTSQDPAGPRSGGLAHLRRPRRPRQRGLLPRCPAARAALDPVRARADDRGGYQPAGALPPATRRAATSRLANIHSDRLAARLMSQGKKLLTSLAGSVSLSLSASLFFSLSLSLSPSQYSSPFSFSLRFLSFLSF